MPDDRTDLHGDDERGFDADLAALADLIDDAFDDVEISDEELAVLALAADPDAPIADDAVPFGGTDPDAFPLLPEWYMPAPGIRRSRGRAAVMLGFAVSLVVINVGGFCVTYGVPEFVWN